MLEGIPSSRSNPKEHTKEPREKLVISDIDDAREHVAELVAQGIQPLITVEKTYIEHVLANGVHSLPKEDGLTGKRFSFIAGTIGIPPLAPSTEERYVLAISPHVRIEPRFTGADQSFHGVVQFPNGFGAHDITIVGKFTNGVFAPTDHIEVGDIKENQPLH